MRVGVPGPVRRHPVLAAFAAGASLAVVAMGLVAYLVVADQRRSARVLSAALSRALARDVRIDRVTDLGPTRVELSGVRLPRAGGWPVDVAAERVEASGPLLAAARGEGAPVQLVVTRPAVTAAPGRAGADLAALDGLREGLLAFLARTPALDVSLTGGLFREREGTPPLAFDLALRAGAGDARAELSLREAAGPALTLSVAAHGGGGTARVAVEGGGSLAPLARWLPGGRAPALDGEPVDLRADADLGPADRVSARARLRLGHALDGGGEVTVKEGLVEVTKGRLEADLGLAALALALPWRPAGRATVGDVTLRWRPAREAWPRLSGAFAVASATLPAAALGTDVALERVEGQVAVEPAGPGLVARGEVRAARIRAAGVDAAPLESRFRASLDARGALAHVALEDVTGSVAGARLRGSVAYEGATRRLDADLGGESVELAGLVRQLAPGWLDTADRLRASGLRVRLAGLDPSGARAGSTEVTARALLFQRAAGRVATGPAAARVALGDAGASVALDAAAIQASLPALSGTLAAASASADLARTAAGGFAPARATVMARGPAGEEVARAEVTPVPGPAGALRLTVRVPALERLDGLWPGIDRRLTGSLAGEAVLSGPGYGTADGRLRVEVPSGELLRSKILLRDAVADLPVRRGPAGSAEPAWGRVEVGEAIGYGFVIHDLLSPARVWNDRLSLNDLAYALYSGEGKGWLEADLEPAGPRMRSHLTGERVRIEEVIGAYGIRGATMTGLLSYDVSAEYRAGRLGVKGRFDVPAGGTVNIELLDRLLRYADTDPSGVVRAALANLRNFEYKSAEADVRSGERDIRLSLGLKGRERFWIFPPRVKEINVRDVPLSVLQRQLGAH